MKNVEDSVLTYVFELYKKEYGENSLNLFFAALQNNPAEADNHLKHFITSKEKEIAQYVQLLMHK
jgi:hypothetical protein